jgi:hypothetical protein
MLVQGGFVVIEERPKLVPDFVRFIKSRLAPTDRRAHFIRLTAQQIQSIALNEYTREMTTRMPHYRGVGRV